MITLYKSYRVYGKYRERRPSNSGVELIWSPRKSVILISFTFVKQNQHEKRIRIHLTAFTEAGLS
jgi:hypothetical protein